MSDLGDLWKDYKKAIIPHIRDHRRGRLTRFLGSTSMLADVAEALGISVRILNGGQHIQFRFEGYIANYYPGTLSFFLQDPQLSPTRKIPPEQALWEFLRQARLVAALPKEYFCADWDFSSNDRRVVPTEVMRIGTYMMPSVREEFLRLAAHRDRAIERVSPGEFEHLVSVLLRDQGYEATVTQASRDGGKDIVCVKDINGRQHILFVECKRWLQHNVGIEIVQRIVGVQHIHKADESMIVTTACFTPDARDEAKRVIGELSLVDATVLRNWIIEFDLKRAADGPSN